MLDLDLARKQSEETKKLKKAQMNQKFDHYNLFAGLFDYPGSDYASQIYAVNRFLQSYCSEAATHLRPFVEYMTKIEILEQQELFIRSFDVQALTTLDLGYVLFGDDYKRGELLVNLNREHREVNNDCGSELADYLANVLRLLPRLRDYNLREEMVSKIVAQALDRMIKGFEPNIIVLKEKYYQRKHKTIIDRPTDDHYTVYQSALKALYTVLQKDFSFQEIEAQEMTSDFLKNIATEVRLEE